MVSTTRGCHMKECAMVGYLEGELGLSLGLAGEDEYTDDEDRGDGGD